MAFGTSGVTNSEHNLARRTTNQFGIQTFTVIYLLFFRANKVTNNDDFDKKRSKAAIRAQALKEMEKEREVSESFHRSKINATRLLF